MEEGRKEGKKEEIGCYAEAEPRKERREREREGKRRGKKEKGKEQGKRRAILPHEFIAMIILELTPS